MVGAKDNEVVDVVGTAMPPGNDVMSVDDGVPTANHTLSPQILDGIFASGDFVIGALEVAIFATCAVDAKRKPFLSKTGVGSASHRAILTLLDLMRLNKERHAAKLTLDWLAATFSQVWIQAEILGLGLVGAGARAIVVFSNLGRLTIDVLAAQGARYQFTEPLLPLRRALTRAIRLARLVPGHCARSTFKFFVAGGTSVCFHSIPCVLGVDCIIPRLI